jgi:hypothetical protein
MTLYKGQFMPPPRKTIAEYEAEATRTASGCLIHPRQFPARTVWQLRNRALATKEYVCHTCDNPQCIEAAHHFIGAAQDNVRDAVAKGRHDCNRLGEQRNRTKLTNEQARQIKYAASKSHAYQLGKEFGVTKHAVHKIIIKKNWTWL